MNVIIIEDEKQARKFKDQGDSFIKNSFHKISSAIPMFFKHTVEPNGKKRKPGLYRLIPSFNFSNLWVGKDYLSQKNGGCLVYLHEDGSVSPCIERINLTNNQFNFSNTNAKLSHIHEQLFNSALNSKLNNLNNGLFSK